MCRKTSISICQAKTQQGNMIVMALFVIVVISLLAAALIKIVSASSNTTIHQVYGLRAEQAAQAGLQTLLQSSFAVDGSATACDTTALSPPSFTNVSGLDACTYEATCVTQTVSFANIDRLYFKYSSTGTCLIKNEQVSRTISVDATQEISP